MNIRYFYNQGGNAISKCPSLYFDYQSSPSSVIRSCRAPLPHRKFSFLHKSRSYSSSKAQCPPDCPCQIYSQHAFCAPPELLQGSRRVHVGHTVPRIVLCTQHSSALSGSTKQVPWRIPAPSLIASLCYHHSP